MRALAAPALAAATPSSLEIIDEPSGAYHFVLARRP
jgi:hypothetical protein